ncbi:MAG: hypothetical protein D6705_05985 [Deltaproteobacteria bacterium]|nr:MAG: hypothetical protein D6705_05985 [Deltaproteobacteria bacterium]
MLALRSMRRRPPTAAFRRFASVIGVFAFLALAGCFRGGEREKEPPPGYAGGLCLAPTAAMPQPHCVDGSVCNAERGFCYDPFDPCRGFFCGGSDRGACVVDAENLPSCTCFAGYSTEQYELLCCPTTPGVDDVCGVIDSSGADGGAGSTSAGTSAGIAPPDAG